MRMPETVRPVPRVDILGVGVDAINMDDALEIIDRWITSGTRQYVCAMGVHGIMQSQRDETLRRIHNSAGLVTPDGLPLVWLSRWRGWRNTTCVYGSDLVLALCERSIATGYRHFFYGGQAGVPERLARRLEKRYPGLTVAGTYSPPFGTMIEEDEAQVVGRINAANSDVVWVGLGTPKQEHWMARHVDRLNASVLIGVGAAFDFDAGLTRQAPRWMQQRGLGWLLRLASEPRRLWRRYLVNNPLFIWLTLQQMWRTRAVRATRHDADHARTTGVLENPTLDARRHLLERGSEPDRSTLREPQGRADENRGAIGAQRPELVEGLDSGTPFARAGQSTELSAAMNEAGGPAAGWPSGAAHRPQLAAEEPKRSIV